MSRIQTISFSPPNIWLSLKRYEKVASSCHKSGVWQSWIKTCADGKPYPWSRPVCCIPLSRALWSIGQMSIFVDCC